MWKYAYWFSTYMLAIVTFLLWWLFFWFFSSDVYAWELSVDPTTQTMSCSSIYPLHIKITHQTQWTISADIKFFLQWLQLLSVVPLSGFDVTLYKWIGNAKTWTFQWQPYYYINAYQQQYNTPISWTIPLATIYVKPIPGYTVWSLQFYDLHANSEDSNISLWTNFDIDQYPITYIDWLSWTQWWSYSLTCPSWWGWGWGSIYLSMDNCTLSSSLPCANESWIDYSSSYYDGLCCPAVHPSAPYCDVSDSPYTDNELLQAFQWAYSLWITNKCPIVFAQLERPILRMEAAKMISLFTTKIIWLAPNTKKTWCDTYPDITALSDEMKYYIKTACQLDIMWLKQDWQTPDVVFNPKEYVTRSQFWTMLSRLIYGNRYNIYSWEEYRYKWYEKHLIALHKDNIIKNITYPNMIEKRGWIMLMLYRTVQDNLVYKHRLVSWAKNGSLVLLESLL